MIFTESDMDNSNSLITRGRIDELLSEGSSSPITYVTGGAGYGKTSAVYSYLQKNDAQTIWVQLSEVDNVETRAWENFSHACSSIDVSFAEELKQLSFPDTASRIQQFLDAYYDYVDQSKKCYLVFDDLHNITNERILLAIRSIAIRIKKNLNIIITSRIKNMLDDIAAYEHEDDEQDLIFEINQEQLAFTRDETTALLCREECVAEPGFIGSIHALSEGWPLIIGMADELLNDKKVNRDYIIKSIRCNAISTIGREFFGQLPDDLRKFTVAMSLISYPAHDLIKALPDGEKMTALLCTYPLLIKYDEFSQVYRLHQLLLEYLKEQVDLLSSDEKADIYRVAANWCRDNGYTIDAIGYYEKLRDYQSIGEVFFTLTPAVTPDVAAILTRIYDDAPPDVFKEIAPAHEIHARLMISMGRSSEAELMLEKVIASYEEMESTPHIKRTLMGAWNALGFIKLFQSADSGRHDFADCFIKGDSYASGIDYELKSPANIMILGAIVSWIGPNDASGFSRHIESIEKSAPLVARSMNGFMYGLAELARAEYCYHRNEMDDAERCALIALSKAREQDQYDIENRSILFLLRIACAAGNAVRVREALDMLKSQLDGTDFYNAQILYDIAAGWFFTFSGSIDKTADWLTRDYFSLTLNEIVVGLEYIVKCRIFLLQKRFHRCAAYIESQTSAHGIQGFLIGKTTFLAMLAICEYNIGNRQRSFELLKEAYEVAEPAGIIMPFVENGNYMRTLTRAAISDGKTGIDKAWLKSINNKSSTFAKRAAFIRSEFQKSYNEGRIIRLTEKETDLLRDLSQGLSRSEAAAANNLSINTVKAMLRIIFDKLGAENSHDAIRIAVSLGILS